MPPKQEGRLVADQRQREQEGKSWKSASTLERQRKRARDRAQGAEKGAAKGKDPGPGKGKAKDKSQPKGKGSKGPEKGKDKSQPKGKGSKGPDKGKGPGGKSGKAEAGPARQPPPPPPSRRQRGGEDIGPQNYPAPKKSGPRQPPVPPSPKRAKPEPEPAPPSPPLSETSPADSVKTDPEAAEASPSGLRGEQASGHKDAPTSGRGHSSEDAPPLSGLTKEELPEKSAGDSSQGLRQELATSSADDAAFALTPHPEEPLPQEEFAPAPADTAANPLASEAETGVPVRAYTGPNKMEPSPCQDSSDKEMESKTDTSPANSPEGLRGAEASGHRATSLETPLAREAEPVEMAVERATTLQNLPPRHEEANAAVPRGNSPPTRGEEPGDMVVDEMASPARIVVLSPQGSSSDGTESSSSGPVRGAEESGPVLRLREAEQEQARGRSPQVVVRRYQGARNRAGRSQELHRPPK